MRGQRTRRRTRAVTRAVLSCGAVAGPLLGALRSPKVRPAPLQARRHISRARFVVAVTHRSRASPNDSEERDHDHGTADGHLPGQGPFPGNGVVRPAVGAEPIMDEPYHVGLRVAGQDVGLDPHGYSRGMTGRWAAGMSMTSPRVWRSSSRPARRSSRRSPMSAGAS